MAVSPTTQRKLGILSGNECAFPSCHAPILDTDHHVIVGQVCHIKATSPGGPRYDPDQTPEERDGFDNLILMCAAHNKIIDDPSSAVAFPVEMLQEFKQQHETRLLNTVVKEEVIQELVSKLFDIPIRFQWEEPPSLVPVVESYMTHADNQMKIDYYDFRVRFTNEGKKTVRSFRLEVEVPNAVANPNHDSLAEVRDHTKGDVRLYRHTEQNFQNFTLYPGETSQHVLMVNYQLRHDQYKDIDASIKVTIYSDDSYLSGTDYPIAAFRNKDRMDQMGLNQ
jgi:hypothetical protein